MSSGPGLRERKKQRTRETIVREAMTLFAERGFEPTTIVEIADAAEIAPRTFFTYFRAKEDVVFHDFDEVREAFAERLRSRGDSETVFDALRAWVADWVEQKGPADPAEQRRLAVVRSSPALEARDRENLAAFGTLLAAGAAADLGEPPDSLHARLVSAAAVAALDALRDFGEGEITEFDEAMAVLDEALAFLQGGLDALRGRSGRR